MLEASVASALPGHQCSYSCTSPPMARGKTTSYRSLKAATPGLPKLELSTTLHAYIGTFHIDALLAHCTSHGTQSKLRLASLYHDKYTALSPHLSPLLSPLSLLFSSSPCHSRAHSYQENILQTHSSPTNPPLPHYPPSQPPPQPWPPPAPPSSSPCATSLAAATKSAPCT